MGMSSDTSNTGPISTSFSDSAVNDKDSCEINIQAASSSLGNILTSCMDMLKIEDAEIRKKAVEFVASVPIGTVNAFGKWITAIKAIADACSVTGKLFSQSEICDFLTIAAKGVNKERADAKIVNDAAFHIYLDIMENYQNAEENLKVHFPRVIADTISALDKGIDTRGMTVGAYSIERYYQERKSTAPKEDPLASYSSRPIGNLEKAEISNPPEESKKLTPTYSEELAQNMVHMTGRSMQEIERALANLPVADIKKITKLSENYQRLEKYNNLLSNPEAFQAEVEKELGRRLTDNQLQHAINSIRKSKTYIENILDGKFIPHGTHGINHIKHNLEYGYQLMGLMEPRKRRSS
jgi:hypothetical protein